MDKKQKKRLDVLQQKVQKLRQQLSGARQQDDDPAETRRLAAELERVEQEIASLKS